MKPHIQIIVGSTRPGRVGINIANWFMDQIKANQNATYELIDLKKINLPLFDEPRLPAQQKYDHEHTKKWSEAIKKGDAYVWVTPEYNHGAGPALTNAIDYLYNEWLYKPVSFVGYGGMGGTRAIEQLVSIASELEMVPLQQRVHIVDPWSAFDEQGDMKMDHVKGHPDNVINMLAKWAHATKVLRENT
jgi:NAD(P)H-dependent FMN reductase